VNLFDDPEGTHLVLVNVDYIEATCGDTTSVLLVESHHRSTETPAGRNVLGPADIAGTHG
jgi:hypothetical protein